MAKTVNEIACAKLDARIAELQSEIAGLERSKAIINATDETTEAPKARKPRGPNKRKRGLPQPLNEADAVGLL